MYCKLACKYMGFFVLLRSEATERAKGTRGSALYGYKKIVEEFGVLCYSKEGRYNSN